MEIAFAVTLVLLGITLTANFCARRWLNVAVKERDKCYELAEQRKREAETAKGLADYYRNEASYWKGLAYGDKAQTIYATAVNSLENGDGFSLKTTPAIACQPTSNKR